MKVSICFSAFEHSMCVPLIMDIFSLLYLVLEMPPMSRVALLMDILYILTLDARVHVGVPVYGDVDFGPCLTSLLLTAK